MAEDHDGLAEDNVVVSPDTVRVTDARFCLEYPVDDVLTSVRADPLLASRSDTYSYPSDVVLVARVPDAIRPITRVSLARLTSFLARWFCSNLG